MVFSSGVLDAEGAHRRFDETLERSVELPFAKQPVIERTTRSIVGYSGVWQHAGYRVVGATLAARAAAELEATAGIPARPSPASSPTSTIPTTEGSRPGCVVVIDEAGMVGTRTLARLLDHAARRRRESRPRRRSPPAPRDRRRRAPARPRPTPRPDPPHPESSSTRSLGTRRARAAARRRDRRRARRLPDPRPRRHQPHRAPRPARSWSRTGGPHASPGSGRLMVAARWFDVDDLNARARHHVDAPRAPVRTDPRGRRSPLPGRRSRS